MATGTIRAAYIYEYMDPSHLNDLHTNGMNTVLLKMLTEFATPLQIRYWRHMKEQADALGMAIYPVFNYHNQYYLTRYAHPARRYQSTSGPLSVLRSIACPNDSRYMRAMMIRAFQRLPQATQIIWDPEFPSGPGGFHSWGANAAPCFCDPCRIEYYRSLNCPDQHCEISVASVNALYDFTNAGVKASMLAFQQTLHQTLVTKYAKQAGYFTMGIFDNDASDSYIDYTVAGLRAGGKDCRIFSELTYTTGGPVTVEDPPQIGGLWLQKHDANIVGGQRPLSTKAINMGSGGYWLFTTYSLWLGQTAVDALPGSSDYSLAAYTGTPGTSVAAYYAAIASANA